MREVREGVGCHVAPNWVFGKVFLNFTRSQLNGDTLRNIILVIMINIVASIPKWQWMADGRWYWKMGQWWLKLWLDKVESHEVWAWHLIASADPLGWLTDESLRAFCGLIYDDRDGKFHSTFFDFPLGILHLQCSTFPSLASCGCRFGFHCHDIVIEMYRSPAPLEALPRPGNNLSNVPIWSPASKSRAVPPTISLSPHLVDSNQLLDMVSSQPEWVKSFSFYCYPGWIGKMALMGLIVV